MEQTFRLLSLAAGLVFCVVSVGFLLGESWATGIWPFESDETRLGFVFLASIAIAVAVPALWLAASGETRAAAAGGLDLAVMFGCMSGYLVYRAIQDDDMRHLVEGLVAGVLAGLYLGIFVYARRYAWRDARATPRFVTASFGLFAVLLVLVAAALIAQMETIFPWPLAGESSVMYGFVFLGAAVYFLVGVGDRSLANATGQLLGFLAYDLVLIGPFLAHFGDVLPDHRTSLIVYTAVVVYSGALAAYVLFVDRGTRLTVEP